MFKKILIPMFLLLVLILAVSSVNAADNINETVNVNETSNELGNALDDDIISESSDDSLKIDSNDSVKSSSDLDDETLTSSNGVFVDASDAYKELNIFRGESGVWYWNKGDSSKTVLNTNSKNSLIPLTRDADLEKTAQLRAQEIAEYFSHTRPDGTDCFTAYPSSLWAMGENIAYGYVSCKDVTEAWKETKDKYAGQGHRRNMLSTSFNCVGIAGFKVNGVIYWVQAFGYKKGLTTSNVNLAAKLKTPSKVFKASTKTKKYSVTLKAYGKAVRNAKVTIKIKGKTYKAKTNAKGKATFKIKKLNKKGTYKGVVKFKGNKFYKKITKKAKIVVKK